MTPQQMRDQAKELVLGAKARLDAAELSQSERVQISVITDQVNAYTMATLAGVLESLTPYSRAAKARKIIEQNDAIRAAAAKGFESGDWSILDGLIDGNSGGAGEGESA